MSVQWQPDALWQQLAELSHFHRKRIRAAYPRSWPQLRNYYISAPQPFISSWLFTCHLVPSLPVRSHVGSPSRAGDLFDTASSCDHTSITCWWEFGRRFMVWLGHKFEDSGTQKWKKKMYYKNQETLEQAVKYYLFCMCRQYVMEISILNKALQKNGNLLCILLHDFLWVT